MLQNFVGWSERGGFETLMRVRRPKNVRWGKTKSLIGARGLCDGINMVEPRARPCAAIKYNVKLYNRLDTASKLICKLCLIEI